MAETKQKWAYWVRHTATDSQLQEIQAHRDGLIEQLARKEAQCAWLQAEALAEERRQLIRLRAALAAVKDAE